jgi:hypothetical protein
MLPVAFDANGHGGGIDAAPCLVGFDATCGAAGFGNLSNSATGFSGNRYAITQQPHLIPDTTRQSMVVERGSRQRNQS